MKKKSSNLKKVIIGMLIFGMAELLTCGITFAGLPAVESYAPVTYSQGVPAMPEGHFSIEKDEIAVFGIIDNTLANLTKKENRQNAIPLLRGALKTSKEALYISDNGHTFKALFLLEKK